MDKFSDPLPGGTTLLQGQYCLKTFLNDGGFGITYLARDSLDRPMVIKECFPRAICRRSDKDVGTRAISHREEFRSIVKAFEEEARNLSKFEHPNIIKVHQVFDENQTAYMAMDYVDGHELIVAIEQDKLTADLIISIALKLLDALAEIHANGMLHRDISPDNILLDQDYNPVLIDFGAAKQEASQHGPKMTSIRVTKDGYSPQEFYVSGAQQFPSSDLYAFAATLYHAITGSAPPESQARLLALAQERPDPYAALSGQFNDYPAGLLKAIDLALSIAPKDRLNAAQDWLDLIETTPQYQNRKSHIPKRAWYRIGLTTTAALALGLGGWHFNGLRENTVPSTKNLPVRLSANVAYLAPQIIKTQSWELDLPFTLKTTDAGVIIEAVAAWVEPEVAGQWLVSGTRLLSVNGQTITGPDDFNAAIMLSQDKPLPEVVVADIQYITDQSPTPRKGQLQLRAKRSQGFSNGMQFEEHFRKLRWQLVVLSPPDTANADLKTGDIILAERVLGLSAVTLDQLNDVLQKLEQRNLPKGVFSIQRGDTLELANLPLEQKIP